MNINEANRRLDELDTPTKDKSVGIQGFAKRREIFEATVRPAEIVAFEGRGLGSSMLINVGGAFHARVYLTRAALLQVLGICADSIPEPETDKRKVAAE